jgi:uncharacterized protein (TIGR02118 family)
MSNVQITVLYPNTPDATFNMDYYLKSHMPLVAEEFGPYNFEGYSVLKLVGTPDPNTKSEYSVQATLNFKTVEDFQKALGDKAPKVLSDVPNFSNKDPMIMVGQKMA